VTGSGALKFDACCGEVPVKSTVASRFILVDRDFHLDARALVHLIVEGAVMQPVDDAPHAFGRIVLNVAHIGFHHGKREMVDHAAQFLHALEVGGDLRLEVVDVLHRIARRISGAREQRIELRFAKPPAIDQLEVVNIDAFLFDRGCVR